MQAFQEHIITFTLGSYVSIFHMVSINIVGMNIVSGLRRLTRSGTCKDEDSVSIVQHYIHTNLYYPIPHYFTPHPSSNYSTPHHTPHQLIHQLKLL